MRIALICPQDFTAYLCCKWIIKGLQEKGYKIFIISPVSKDDFYYKKLLSLNIEFIKVKMNRHINIIDDIKYFFSLLFIFKKYRIKSIFSFCTKPNIYSPLAAKFANIKDIYISVWGRGTIFLESEYFKIKILRKILLIMYKLSFVISQKIWFTNKYDLEYFKSKNILSQEKVILTPNYIDTEEYNPNFIKSKEKLKLLKELNIKKNDIVIILVGRMIFSKGIKEFHEASLIVNNLYPNSKFLLVGAEEENNPDYIPREYLNNLQKYEHFQWLGYRKDVKELYSISSIATLPSYYPEGGYPRAITEPMSMGLAVIAANTKNCKGSIIDNFNGLLVEPQNSQDLASKIIMLIKKPKLCNDLGEKARKSVIKNFDEKVIVSELLNSINKKNN